MDTHLIHYVPHPEGYETGGPAPTPPDPGDRLPSDFDTTLFSDDQLDYLADYLEDKFADFLRRAYRQLTTSPTKRVATPREIGINLLIYAKILNLDTMLATADWTDMHRIINCRKQDFCRHLAQIRRHLYPRKYSR